MAVRAGRVRRSDRRRKWRFRCKFITQTQLATVNVGKLRLLRRFGSRWNSGGWMAATRWLTFDCYGTLADWNACMLSALEPVAGASASTLLAAYHRAEAILEAGPQWRPYREILTDGLTLASRRTGIGVPAAVAGALVESWPGMAVLPDVDEALTALVASGWHLGILTNCDNDLFESTAAKLPAPFEVVVTAEQVRSYKPD